MQTDFLEKPLPPCEFSPCRKYRYTLWRRTGIKANWFPGEFPNGLDSCPKCDAESGCAGNADRFVQFICLNPSTADDSKDDPTVRRCIGFAKQWGFGGFCMTNLFAWRDTSPAAMKRAVWPVGEHNDKFLQNVAMRAGMVVCAWGAHGTHLDRARIVRAMLNEFARNKVHALRVTSGEPWHPLYLPKTTKPFKLP